MKLSTKILLGLLVLVLIAQAFRINKTNPSVEQQYDMVAIYNAPEQVQTILKQACYDCHSHETTYPWYTNVAPMSWWIADHIEEGREHLNFSVWGTYDAKRQKHKLEEMAEEVMEGEMPLNSYTWAHSEADLTEEQKNILVDWAKKTMQAIP